MKDIEKLINSYIESATYIDNNYMDRVVKIHNRHTMNMIRIAEYLAKVNKLDALYPLLKHPVNYVRYSAAYDLIATA